MAKGLSWEGLLTRRYGERTGGGPVSPESEERVKELEARGEVTEEIS